MSSWVVYSKNGLAKCEVRQLEYSGEFLGACSVSLNIVSPTPISFEIGDWLEYRGERFELNYDPSVVKQSSALSIDDAFIYENLIFNSLSDELARCDFLDVVPSDNGMHYSSLPTFNFFAESIETLAERIQANLDRIYKGDKAWTIVVHSEYVNKTNINITASNLTCWDALALAKSQFDANFIIKGRTVTIGTSGIAVGNLFTYGKSNGLYRIERNSESNQKIVTRLRAYGSTRNMPSGYYRNVEGGNAPNNMAVTNLMLPSFPADTLDPYIDSENIDELGVREGAVFFDGSGDLEEIYPTMEGMTAEDLADAGIVVDANGALDVVVSAEQIEDDGVTPEEGEIQATFTITLKDIGFDINDHLGTSSATISMKDGMCGGRDFEITECEKDGSNYILTCNRTEDTGLGLYFPYKDYQIKSGDKFVLINLEMPDVYIKAASQRLLSAAKEYLAKNDYVRYSYTPFVDNIFMARQHEEAVANGTESIHDTIKEGDFILFEDDDLGISGSVTIDSLTIKESTDENVVPEYEITLKNEKTVGALDKIQNQITSIQNGQSSLNTEQVSSIVEAVGSRKFLRKDKEDTAKEKITFEKGIEFGKKPTEKGVFLEDDKVKGVLDELRKLFYIESADFLQGELGSGFLLKYDEDKKRSYLEIDELLVRKIAYFISLVIKELKHVGGTIVLTPASMKCSKVETYTTYYRCYFENEHDGATINQEFVAGDLARCQTFNVKEGYNENVRNTYYWRYVVSVGDNYIDLSIADCDEGSDIPQKGDEIVQLGNRYDDSRQNAIILSTVGDDAPSFKQYQGINNYYLSDDNAVTIFSPSNNLIKGKFVSQVTGRDFDEELEKLQVDWDAVLEQTDKEFTMWFYEHEPALDNEPAVNWDSEELKQLHNQDLFYNRESGLAYRFENVAGVWVWSIVTDADTIRALEKAAEADKKAKEVQKEIDEIVSDGVLSALEKKEVLKEWETIVSAYPTNISNAEKYGLSTSAYTSAYLALGSYLNGGEWNGNGTPSWLGEHANENTPIDAEEYRSVWIGHYDAESALLEAVSDAIKGIADNKKRVFVDTPVPPYDAGDMWVNATYKDGVVSHDDETLVCIISRSEGELFSINDWRLSNGYSASIKNLGDRIEIESKNIEDNKEEIGNLTVKYNEISATVSKIEFDDNGQITSYNKSGLMLSENFASMFTEAYQNNEAVRAEIATYAKKNANGTLESGVIITGDQLSLNGYTVINGKFEVSTEGNVTMTDCVINGELNVHKEETDGTLYNIYVGPNGYYGSPSIEFNKDGTVYAYMGLADDEGTFVGTCIFLYGTSGKETRLTPGNLCTRGGFYSCDISSTGVLVSSTGDSRSILIGNDAITLNNGATIANLGIKNFGTYTTGSTLRDFNYVDSDVTLPSPSLYQGRMVFFKGRSSSITLTCTGKIIKYYESSTSDSMDLNDESRILVSDGSYWYEFAS